MKRCVVPASAVPYSRSSPTLLCPTDFGSNMASFAYILVFSPLRCRAVPLYRDWNPTVSDHFYTVRALAEIPAPCAHTFTPTSPTPPKLPPPRATRRKAPRHSSSPPPVPGAVRLLRLYNAAPSDHFYTTNTTEAAGAVAGGYKLEDLNPIYVYPSALCGSVPLYRLFAGGVGDHFYTADAAERDGAEGSGWGYEWVAGRNNRGETPCDHDHDHDHDLENMPLPPASTPPVPVPASPSASAASSSSSVSTSPTSGPVSDPVDLLPAPTSMLDSSLADTAPSATTTPGSSSGTRLRLTSASYGSLAAALALPVWV
ncbi:hypothetical protein B0H14DRAFT_3458304 [Mycena olivaceomarginata]|nr:hypothetical protein B0H14DRAFT_3458304 [Mycena olivaceomarginata]